MNSADVSRLAYVIDAIGSERLGQAVDAAVQATLAFDMSCAYLFRFNQPPVLVHDGYRQRVAERTLKAYLRGGYLLDPFYVACTHQHPAGLWRMSDLAPDSFHASGFSISRDIHPCVSSHHGSLIEEIGFIVPVQPKTALVYSLMRGLDQGAFSEAELQALAALAPVIESAFGLHLSLRERGYLQTVNGRGTFNLTYKAKGLCTFDNFFKGNAQYRCEAVTKDGSVYNFAFRTAAGEPENLMY